MSFRIFIPVVLILALASAEALKAQSSGKIRSRKIKQVTIITTEKDKKGRETEVKMVRAYDKKGNLTSEAVYAANGDLKRRKVYEYNRFGKQTARYEYDSKNLLRKQKLTEYHNYFRKPVKEVYWENGEIARTKTTSYDVNGKRIRQTTRNAKGDVTRERKYFYDNKGMLSRREDTLKSGSTKVIAWQYEN